jgi:ribonuclease III
MSLEVPSNALQALQSEIHYEFKQVKLLIQALTHSSHANEQGCPHNERLEFLGDAVLELAVSHELFRKFPEVQEGHLTKMRSALVSEGRWRRWPEGSALASACSWARERKSRAEEKKIPC